MFTRPKYENNLLSFMDKKINRNQIKFLYENSEIEEQSSSIRSQQSLSQEQEQIHSPSKSEKPDYELDSQGMKKAELAFEMIEADPELSQSDKKKNIDSQIRSILKATNVKEVLDEKKKKKRIRFNEEDNKEYIIQNEGRKWNETLSNPKKGKYEPYQQKLLMKSLFQCLKEKHISLDQIVQSISNEESLPRDLNFWNQVCSVLSHRPLISSYKYLKRALNSKNQNGQWTQEQVTRLKELIDKHGKKWSRVAKEMKRTAENIRDKYRSLMNENSQAIPTQMWKFSEVVEFIRLLQKYSNTTLLEKQIDEELKSGDEHDKMQLKELERKRYNSKHFIFHNNLIIHRHLSPDFKQLKQEQLPWLEISNKIKTKTVFDCRNKFLQLMMIQSHQFRNREDYELQIAKFVSESKAKYESEINWSKWGNTMNISGQQAKNRYLIFKRNIEGRGQKSFKQLVQAMRSRVGLKNC